MHHVWIHYVYYTIRDIFLNWDFKNSTTTGWEMIKAFHELFSPRTNSGRKYCRISNEATFSLSILFLALLMGSRTWSKSSSMPRWHNDGHILFWLMIFRPSDERKSVALSRMPETAVVIAIIDDLNLSRSARKSLGRAEYQIRECLPLRDRRH